MQITRRQALRAGLVAGLTTPLWPRRLLAAGSADPARPPQLVLLCHSPAGDPLNANAPLTYDYADIAHPSPTRHPELAPVSTLLGGRRYTMAKVWADWLHSGRAGQEPAERTCFIHHSSPSASHHQRPGDGDSGEPLADYLARRLARRLGTPYSQPLYVGAEPPTGTRPLLAVTPTALRQQLTALLQPPARRWPLPLPSRLLGHLDQIDDDGPTGQLLAATTLLALRLSPVVCIELPFGGDNHTDGRLDREAAEHIATLAPQQHGVALRSGLPFLLKQLAALGLFDAVTVVLMNSFGRTLRRGGSGRDHSAAHQVTVLCGRSVRAGVVGGLARSGSDYSATAIDGKSGHSDPAGDIAVAGSQAAVCRTIAAAVGIPEAVAASPHQPSTLIRAALA